MNQRKALQATLERVRKLENKKVRISERKLALRAKERECDDKVKDVLRKHILTSGILAKTKWIMSAETMPNFSHYRCEHAGPARVLHALLKRCPTSGMSLEEKFNKQTMFRTFVVSLSIHRGRSGGITLFLEVNGVAGRKQLKSFVERHGMQFQTKAADVRRARVFSDHDGLIKMYDALGLGEIADDVRKEKKSLKQQLKKRGLAK